MGSQGEDCHFPSGVYHSLVLTRSSSGALTVREHCEEVLRAAGYSDAAIRLTRVEGVIAELQTKKSRPCSRDRPASSCFVFTRT